MKIKAEQLARTLKNQSPPLIWLAGDEPLLLQESADLVRQHYRGLEYVEREILNVDKSFNWDHFLQASGNLSLFAENKIIELRMHNSKLEDAGKKALQQYLQQPDANLLILLSSPKVEKAAQNSKWFKQIESHSLLVQIWPVNREALADWLAQRLLREGIRADAEALQVLSDKIEGNLLAAMQEIQKLKLLAASNSGETINLDARTVLQVVADNTRYTAYQAVDAALLGDVVRAQKILQGLRAEGVFPLAVLAAMIRELHNLAPMLEKKSQGQGINAIMQTSHVWFNRKQAVGSALQRLSGDAIWPLLEQARVVDQSVKGMNSANCWDELSQLFTRLAGTTTAAAP